MTLYVWYDAGGLCPRATPNAAHGFGFSCMWGPKKRMAAWECDSQTAKHELYTTLRACSVGRVLADLPAIVAGGKVSQRRWRRRCYG